MCDPFNRRRETIDDLFVEETNLLRRGVVSEYANDAIVLAVLLETLKEIGTSGGIEVLQRTK